MLIRRISLVLLAALSSTTAALGQLRGVASFDGRIALSVDGLGTNAVGGGHLQVLKPHADSTVRAAYLVAASNNGYSIQNGDVVLNGQPVQWSESFYNNAGLIGSFFHNVLGEVTDAVRATLDAAPAGTHQIPVQESSTEFIDGTVLAVIFDDPSVETVAGVVLLFGGQQTLGDEFTISLGQGLDLSDPQAAADMGLGITFGYQGDLGSGQVSILEVNNQRVSSSAGGEDDGGGDNGQLITVGGLGDSNLNPFDPFGGASNRRTDDELYNLLPFADNGDTQILVKTRNPSDDDNIFFGYFRTSIPISVAEETIFSGPFETDLALGCDHLVLARVQDAATQDPIVGRPVQFEIVSGPNAGLTQTDVTDAGGIARFTYSSGGAAGEDSIVARMVNSNLEEQVSNTAQVKWHELLALPYCYGTNCPCGNDYSEGGCLNSTGLGSVLSASGTGSVLTDDLVLTATQCPANRFGLLYMGAAGANAPFGDGLRCVGAGSSSGIFRYLIQHTGSAGVLQEGPGIVAESHARFPPTGRIAACQTWHFQAFFRDAFTAPCGSGWNLSNGIAITFGL